MDMKFFLAFWLLFVVTGISIIINTGATFSSVTCVTGEVVGNIKQCPQCVADSDCQIDGDVDSVCDIDKNKCKPRYCLSIIDCVNEDASCNFNQCVVENIDVDY